MRVQFDPEYSIKRDSNGRHHPWTEGEADSSFKYYNFKEQPELIEQVLEDFVPFAEYESVAKFYDLVRFLNSPDSVFESNDCALQVGDNNYDLNGKSQRARGRILILTRELAYNTKDEAVDFYLSLIGQKLFNLDQHFELGAILLTKFPTLFIEIPAEEEKQQGYCGEILFWAWGDNEAETMTNLARVFDNLSSAIKEVSEFIKQSMAKRDASGG